MNRHSVFYKATPKPKIKATKILQELKKVQRKRIRNRKVANPKSKIKMAERTGLEPASPYGR